MHGNACPLISKDLSKVQNHTCLLLSTNTVDFHLHFRARRWLQKLLPTVSQAFLTFLVFPHTFIAIEVRLLSAVNSNIFCLCGALLRAIPHLITQKEIASANEPIKQCGKPFDCCCVPMTSRRTSGNLCFQLLCMLSVTKLHMKPLTKLHLKDCFHTRIERRLVLQCHHGYWTMARSCCVVSYATKMNLFVIA